MDRLILFLAIIAVTGVFAASKPEFSDDFSSASLKDWGGMGGTTAEIASHGGRADGAGVVMRNGEKGSGISRSLPVVPGTYEYVFWSKAVNVSGPIGVRGGVEFYDKDGKFVHPYYYGTPSGESDAFGWRKTVVRVPRIPERAASIRVFCQLAPQSTGEVYFDDISFRSAVSPLLAVMTHPANQTASPGDSVSFQVVHASGDVFSATGVTVHVTGPTGFPPQDCVVTDGKFSFVLPEIADGGCPLSITMGNAPAEAVPKSLEFPLNVRRSPRRTTYDKLGRTFIDGKPFMPLGFYTCGGFGTNTTARLKECGANTILSYSTIYGLGKNVAEMRKNLARLDGLGVKTIFALNTVYPGVQWSRTSFDGARGCDAVVEKVVKGLRDCPGLLAWYLNDEMSFSDMLVKRRDLVSALDPDHPAFVEVYGNETAPAYRRTSDIFSVCCYPVRTDPPAETSMSLETSERSYAAFGREGNPVWGIPQCHNSVVYGKKGSRAPTEEEMRTVALHFAGLGCKGFLFYNLSDLWSPKQPDADAAFAAHWPEVCRVFAFLKAFEPWIMSGNPVQRLPTDKMTARGNVRVYRFRDDAGRNRVVFIGGGPGAVECRIALPAEGQSLFGRTVRQGDEWVFSGEGLCSDVWEMK